MSETDVPRISPHRVSAEPAAVREWLDFHRATLLRKCAGLDDEQLKRASCPPSNLTLLGLVRHMTDVERGWFLRGVGGHSEAEVPPLYYSDEEPEGDVEDLDSASTQAVFATYEQTIAEIRAATADADLDATFTRGSSPFSVRWAFLHMIEEYARHNGHADLIRERIDGATGQ
ncbi:MAG TPA: DinB family protein [Streptosporangiaceae bacterium]|jgi:uncharacterized damage-inducible protein DinB|nr:DinB family protein [Streptosporangiaceae bacterium]